MESEFIIDVTEADFEIQVITYSLSTPVVVDFWAEWCAPCRVLGPIIEKLAVEAQGGFRLAKLNVDGNPNLSKQLQIHSIPAVKVFQAGKMVAEFTGLRPEGQVRDFIRNAIPTADDLLIEKGFGLLRGKQFRDAEVVFRQALSKFPEQPGALLGLSETLLLQDRAAESLVCIKKIATGREYNAAQLLIPLAHAMVSFTSPDGESNIPMEAAFSKSIYLVKRGNLEAAMDGLLDILRQDKTYKSGLPRKIILAIFELLGEDNPICREYRAELASILF